MLKQTIGFIGAGQMARALAQGFVAAGLLADKQIIAADPISKSYSPVRASPAVMSTWPSKAT
jgi:pyrroline-5-carboxylate reductase